MLKEDQIPVAAIMVIVAIAVIVINVIIWVPATFSSRWKSRRFEGYVFILIDKAWYHLRLLPWKDGIQVASSVQEVNRNYMIEQYLQAKEPDFQGKVYTVSFKSRLADGFDLRTRAYVLTRSTIPQAGDTCDLVYLPDNRDECRCAEEIAQIASSKAIVLNISS